MSKRAPIRIEYEGGEEAMRRECCGSIAIFFESSSVGAVIPLGKTLNEVLDECIEQRGIHARDKILQVMVNTYKGRKVGVTAFREMFKGCSMLELVRIDEAELGRVDDASSMFEGCANLKVVEICSDYFNPRANVTNMFAGCTSLKRASVKLPYELELRVMDTIPLAPGEYDATTLMGVSDDLLEIASDIFNILGADMNWDVIATLLADHGLQNATVADIMRNAPDMYEEYLAKGKDGFSRAEFVREELYKIGVNLDPSYVEHLLDRLGLLRASKMELMKKLPDLAVESLN